MIYLDAAATTPVRREALEAMWPYLTGAFGNPSSHHSLGEQAARALASARERVAACLGCRPGEIIFTSGGTEADNLAIKGIALASPRGRHIVTSAIEHEAVLASCDYLKRQHGFEITVVPVDAQGRVHGASLAESLRPDTTLCSLMLANNEVGTIGEAFIDGVLAVAPDALLTGDLTQRLPNNASFCFPGTSGEAVLLQLEERGVLCSSGSACAAGSDEPSHVLMAMGFSREVAQTAVRFTLAADTTTEQVEEVIAKVKASIAAVQSLASAG